MKKISLGKIKITNKGLYWGLILTFFVIYICVGFVSTLHAITFFQMANTMGLAVLLALAFEVGQSSVLFSILMTKNKEKFLPWVLMVLLTGLQITGNVFASFKHIMTSGNLDWQYFQKSILFGVQAANPEMYQVIISWLQGALLPVVALGLTALVAQNISILIPREEEQPQLPESLPKNKDDVDESGIGGSPTKEQEKQISDTILEEKRKEQLTSLKDKLVDNAMSKASFKESHPIIGEGGIEVLEEHIEIPLRPATQEEANAEFEKSHLNKDEKAIVVEEWPDNYLDEEAAELTPKLQEQKKELLEKISESTKEGVGKTEEEKEKILTDFTKKISNQKDIRDFFPEKGEEFIAPGIIYIPEQQPNKKRGRPPKQKEKVAEPKKEQGPLQKEENVSVPQKERKSRTLDPLKRKSTTQVVTDLKQIIKPSKGEEVIRLLESTKKPEVVVAINEPIKGEEIVQESIITKLESSKTSYVDDHGVEVIDAKAIEKQPSEVKKK
jgi:hypothetical protein